MSLKKRLRAISLETRFQISCREWLWPLMFPFSRSRMRRFRAGSESLPEEARVHRGLALVIDGFPGSANSFATRAFRAMQEERVPVGNHYHSPAETIRATRLGVPVLLTLRRPIDSVSSMVRRWPFVPFESALRWYVMFYEAVEPHLDQMVLSDFGTTTNEFPAVVAALNQKFGTSFGTSLPAERMAEFEPRLRQSEEERQRRVTEKREMESAYLGSTSEPCRRDAEAIFARLAHRSLGD
ncbi:MAG: hypothetical protein MK194_03740 [Roseibacillus sp.]|nr:hypothetical protein [Roseibacillus sp.]